jgi:uncharacterized protein YjiS (DUF1127 family)
MLHCNRRNFTMAQLMHGFGQDAAPAGVSGLAPVATLIGRIGGWLAERRLRAETMRELSLLNPRDLQDLAIAPSDFEAIARGNWKR